MVEQKEKVYRISILIDNSHAEFIRKIVHDGKYANLSDFVKQAIAEKVKKEAR